MKISALVPTGHGINCELETRRALELAGFDRIDLVHLNFLANGEADPANYQMVVFPGGFLVMRRIVRAGPQGQAVDEPGQGKRAMLPIARAPELTP